MARFLFSEILTSIRTDKREADANREDTLYIGYMGPIQLGETHYRTNKHCHTFVVFYPSKVLFSFLFMKL